MNFIDWMVMGCHFHYCLMKSLLISFLSLASLLGCQFCFGDPGDGNSVVSGDEIQLVESTRSIINNVVAVVHGSVITEDVIKQRALPRIKEILKNRDAEQSSRGLEEEIFDVLDQALDEIILAELVAEHVKEMPPVDQVLWQLDFANLSEEKKGEVIGGLEEEGNVRRFDTKFEALIRSLLGKDGLA